MFPEALTCAFCRRRAVDPAFRPFCSERCRLLDLAGWIDGTYRVPAEPVSSHPTTPDDDAPQS